MAATAEGIPTKAARAGMTTPRTAGPDQEAGAVTERAGTVSEVVVKGIVDMLKRPDTMISRG